jgi:hypothetical protein
MLMDDEVITSRSNYLVEEQSNSGNVSPQFNTQEPDLNFWDPSEENGRERGVIGMQMRWEYAKPVYN